ncbi:MAG: hypothetical protein HZA53_06975 [Planctomycetes bacterium]|nr:hypothetical protein [Planctomycetota bacterium]
MRGTRMVWVCALIAVACQSGRGTKASVDPRMAQPKVELQLNFDRTQPESMPSGFTALAGAWSVVEDPTAPSKSRAFASTAPDAKLPCNLALLDDVRVAEVELTVKLRAVSGEEEQGGGLVWRAKDAKNFYLARWNPREKNLRLFEVIDGEKRQLATDSVRVEPGWHELRITAKGEQMRVYLDGRAYLQAKDASFLEPGKVGLWTRADARTYFDDLEIKSRAK